MTVRQSLLAILDQAPSYGYQLRSEFDARTGGTWPLNVGQVYTTLDRLERDGLVTSDGADAEGRVRYVITEAGTAEVRGWLSTPVQRQQARDELAMKLAVASTLPGVDMAALIQTQRSATLRTLQELTRTKAAQASPASAADLAWSLVVESMIFAAEAEVRWLDHSEATIARALRSGVLAPTTVETPARGRIAQSGGAR
jgi:DNA-binding PadR family transcriptional regulator